MCFYIIQKVSQNESIWHKMRFYMVQKAAYKKFLYDKRSATK